MNSQNETPEMLDALRFEEYRSAIGELVGVKSRYMQMPSDASRPFWILAYDAVPDKGSTTAFTFGISSVPDESWRAGRPEVVFNVDSEDDEWILSLGAICAELRGTCPFSLGNVLRFGKPLSSESQMSAFFLFWPTILDKSQQQVRLVDRTINFVQAYPVFDSECETISTIGPEKFFMRDETDFADITRKEKL